jgi:hypothetical protein
MSYEAETTIARKKAGKYEIYCFAGSYNPGNQPEYGRDWEYYDVNVYLPGKIMDDLIESKKFTSKIEAKKYFNKKVEEYKKKKTNKKSIWEM